MGVKKDIGKTYNEQLKNLEASPNENVWERIQNTLETKKKKKFFSFWFRMVGAGLAIFILGGIVYKMSDKNKSDINSIEKNENIPNNRTIIPSKTNNVLISDSTKNILTQSEGKDNLNEKKLNSDSSTDSNLDSIIKNKTLTNHNSTDKNISESKYSESRNSIDRLKSNSNNQVDSNLENSEKSKSNINLDNKITEKSYKTISNINKVLGIDSSISNSENKINLEKQLVKNLDSTFKKDTLLVALKKDAIPKKKLPEKDSEWEVGAYIIPTYFGSLSKGSSLGEILEDSDKQVNITLSYRVLGHFKLSEKLTIRTGFGNTKLSYTTIDATATDMNGELENLRDFPGISFNFTELNDIYTNDLLGTSSSIDFKQELTYFEIPIELIYKIPKNKIEWKVFGGASFFKLSENKIIAKSSEGSYYIGDANNLSKYTYSVNLGGGFDYKISNKANLTVEPIFKYHINTFSRKSYDFKPISTGISFGATYKF